MALKIDAELEWQLIYAFKNDMKNFAIFPQAFFQIDLDEKVKTNHASWHWRVMQKLKKKLTLPSKNDMRNLMNFNASSGRSESSHFDVLLL